MSANVWHKRGKKLIKEQQQDLRIRRTRGSIRKTFSAMLCEMDYDQITIRELADRAQINRKTFYLHYQNLGSLLEEFQKELAAEFIERTSMYDGLRDAGEITREFFLALAQDPLHQKLICNGNSSHIGDTVAEMIASVKKKTDDSFGRIEDSTQNIITAYLASSSKGIYRQWVFDGKNIPLDDLITLATKLIRNGIMGVANQQETDGNASS
jgi:AcrR family transcriptional regulator